jgi:hypothetical protein
MQTSPFWHFASSACFSAAFALVMHSSTPPIVHEQHEICCLTQSLSEVQVLFAADGWDTLFM